MHWPSPERSPSRMNAVSSSEGVACSMPMTSRASRTPGWAMSSSLTKRKRSECCWLTIGMKIFDGVADLSCPLSSRRIWHRWITDLRLGFAVGAFPLDEDRGRPYRVSEVLYAGMPGGYKGLDPAPRVVRAFPGALEETLDPGPPGRGGHGTRMAPLRRAVWRAGPGFQRGP